MFEVNGRPLERLDRVKYTSLLNEGSHKNKNEARILISYVTHMFSMAAIHSATVAPRRIASMRRRCSS